MAGYPVGTPVLNLVSVAQNPAAIQSSDGSVQNLIGGHQSELFVRELSGKRYAAAARGNVYVASSGAVTLNVYTSTAATATIYNPVGSGKLVELHQVIITQILATDVINGFVLGLPAVGVNPSAHTAVTATAMPLGGSTMTALAVPCSAATVTTPALLRGLGASSLVTTGLASVVGMIFDFDGTIVMAPGSTIVVGTSTTIEGGANTIVDFVWSEWLP